jgi:hypothetical protein
MTEPIDKLRHVLEEPAMAAYLYGGADLWGASMAVSLKRIADALERMDPGKPINAYGETIGEAIQGQHERGLRGIPNPY